MKKILTTLAMLIFCFAVVSAEEAVSITGVDTSKILVNGSVDIYISLQADENAAPGDRGAKDFALDEFNERSGEWTEAEIKSFQYNGFTQEEISLLLLIDNSGSMYDSIAGAPEDNREQQRIFYLLSALMNLFDRTREYKDNISLVTFNTYLSEETPFTSDRSALYKSLNNINKPGKDESYTELYRAMKESMEKLSMRKGRKVLILLTDGEDYTYSENRKEPHPLWGNNLVDQEKLTENFRKSGITLYPIFYTREKDPDLDLLAQRTGGQSYMTASRNELIDAYLEIHERISKEFRLSYTPAVTTGREKSIRVSMADGSVSPAFSYLWEIFWGLPPELPWWIYLVLTALALGIIIIIHHTPFERLYPYTHLEVLSPADESSTILQISEDRTLLAVSSQKTEIIHDENFKERENPDETGVTIIRENDDTYTLKSDKEVMVNNQPVKVRKLSPGDVIRAEGTLIVFDEPEE